MLQELYLPGRCWWISSPCMGGFGVRGMNPCNGSAVPGQRSSCTQCWDVSIPESGSLTLRKQVTLFPSSSHSCRKYLHHGAEECAGSLLLSAFQVHSGESPSARDFHINCLNIHQDVHSTASGRSTYTASTCAVPRTHTTS